MKIEFQPGQKFSVKNFIDQDCELKIMAVADGYAMCRYKGCIPFVVTLKDLKKRISKQENKQ